MKKSVLHEKMIGVCLSVFLTAIMSAPASVFDDAALWYPVMTDANGDGYVGAGEIRDPHYLADADDEHNQAAPWGYGKIGYATMDVTCQYVKKTVPGATCLTFPNDTMEKPTVLDTKFKSSAENYTAVIRFKRDASDTATSGQEPKRLIMNLGYGDNKGVLIGVEKYNCLYVYSGGKTGLITKDHATGNTVTYPLDTWVDLAVVVSGQQMTVYARKDNWQEIRYDIQLSKSIAINPEKTIILGGQSPNGDVFRGAIHQFAFWERALSEAEVYAAFTEKPFALETVDIWQAGYRRSEACPFTGPEAEVDLGDTSSSFRDGKLNASLPSVWTAGTSVSTTFEIPQYFGGLPQALEVLTSAGSGTVNVWVDDVLVGKAGAAAERAERCLIPGDLLAEGKHALRVGCVEGSFTPRFLGLGGSWKLGDSYLDKAAATVAPADYNVATRNLRNLRYANGCNEDGTHYDVSLHFKLDSVEAAGKYELSFDCFGSNPKSDAVDVYLNGVLKEHIDYWLWTGTKTLPIGYDELVPGENVITFKNVDETHAGTKTYMGCNWYRLTLKKPHKPGCVLIVR